MILEPNLVSDPCCEIMPAYALNCTSQNTELLPVKTLSEVDDKMLISAVHAETK